jgi:hypothetical protein
MYRLFLVSWIFAVLWVKGYLWWVFGIAALLFVLEMVKALASSSRSGGDFRPAAPRSHGRASSTNSRDEEDNDFWREPRPPRSAPQTKKP